MGVIDGSSPLGIELDTDITHRKKFLRTSATSAECFTEPSSPRKFQTGREPALPTLRWLRNARREVGQEDNLHLTLLFLGDVDSARIPDLARVMTEAAGRSAPFELALKGRNSSLGNRRGSSGPAWRRWTTPFTAGTSILLSEIRTEGFKPDAKPLKLHITWDGSNPPCLPRWNAKYCKARWNRATSPMTESPSTAACSSPRGPPITV